MSGESSDAILAAELRRCPECGSHLLVHDYARGERHCGDCGLVLSECAIDDGPEWTSYAPEDWNRLARTGPPKRALFGASDLMTVIPYPSRDARGRSIPRSRRNVLRRLRALQFHSSYRRPGERSLRDVAPLLAKAIFRLDLPESAKDEAGLICKRALEKELSRGRSVARIAAAAVYVACRRLGMPRTLTEIEEVTGVKRQAIGRTYRALRRNGAVRALSPPHPRDYVARFCSNLNLSNAVRADSLRLIGVWERFSGGTGMAPAGVAAAAIYRACRSSGSHRSEETIAKAAGITSATLRHRLRDLERATDATRGSSPP